MKKIILFTALALATFCSLTTKAQMTINAVRYNVDTLAEGTTNTIPKGIFSVLYAYQDSLSNDTTIINLPSYAVNSVNGLFNGSSTIGQTYVVNMFCADSNSMVKVVAASGDYINKTSASVYYQPGIHVATGGVLKKTFTWVGGPVGWFVY